MDDCIWCILVDQCCVVIVGMVGVDFVDVGLVDFDCGVFQGGCCDGDEIEFWIKCVDGVDVGFCQGIVFVGYVVECIMDFYMGDFVAGGVGDCL